MAGLYHRRLIQTKWLCDSKWSLFTAHGQQQVTKDGLRKVWTQPPGILWSSSTWSHCTKILGQTFANWNFLPLKSHVASLLHTFVFLWGISWFCSSGSSWGSAWRTDQCRASTPTHQQRDLINKAQKKWTSITKKAWALGLWASLEKPEEMQWWEMSTVRDLEKGGIQFSQISEMWHFHISRR